MGNRYQNSFRMRPPNHLSVSRPLPLSPSHREVPQCHLGLMMTGRMDRVGFSLEKPGSAAFVSVERRWFGSRKSQLLPARQAETMEGHLLSHGTSLLPQRQVQLSCFHDVFLSCHAHPDSPLSEPEVGVFLQICLAVCSYTPYRQSCQSVLCLR